MDKTQETGLDQNAVNDIRKKVASLPGIFKQAARMALVSFAAGIEWKMKKERLSGRPGLIRRTGMLARSMGHAIIEETGQLVLILFAGAKYSRIQEFGGTIKPKNKLFLVLPNINNRRMWTGAGVLRQQYFAGHEGKRFYQKLGLRILKARSGRLFMANPLEGKNKGKMIPYYFLREQVKIPKRLEFMGTVNKEKGVVVPMLDARVNEMLASRFQKTTENAR